MKITYQADDGYVGKTRPLHVTIEDEELLEMFDTAEDAMNFVADEIQDDFNMKVSPSYDSDEIEDRLKELFAKRKEAK